jgi:hypothetical protein
MPGILGATGDPHISSHTCLLLGCLALLCPGGYIGRHIALGYKY